VVGRRHTGVTIATVGRGLVGHVVGRRHGIWMKERERERESSTDARFGRRVVGFDPVTTKCKG